MTTTKTKTPAPRSAPMTLRGWAWSVVSHAPRGLWTVLAAVFHFCRDERRAARIDDMRGTGHYKQIDEEERHQRAMKVRTALVAAPVVAGGVGLLAAPPSGWPLSWLAAAAAVGLVAVGGLGLLGLSVNELPVAPAVITIRDGEPAIKQDLVVEALGCCGVTKIESAIAAGGPAAVRFLSPVHRDGDGVEVEVELPMGASTASLLEDKPHSAFAGGLSRPVERVHLERGRTERHLKVFVADQTMGERGSVPWTPCPTPDHEPPRMSVFEPFPVGVDVRGRPATLRLYTSLGAVYGTLAGMAGSGKTNTAAIALLTATLDPTAEIHIHDAKGSPEFEQVGPAVAHRYQVGAAMDDLEVLATSLEDLCHAEIPARNARMAEIRKANPGIRSEYGPHYAARKTWGLHPIVVFIDENVPFAIDKANKAEAKLKERIRFAASQISATGRSSGVTVFISGQYMGDDKLPKGFKDNAAVAIGMAARSASTANQYLMDGAVGEGFRCDRLHLPDDRGVGYISGDGAKTFMVKFANVSDPALRARIAQAGRQMRITEGRLSGAAAGEIEPDTVMPDIVDQVVFVWPADRELLALTELLDLLADRYHGEFDGLDEVGLGKQIRGAGVATEHDGRPVQITSGPLKGRKAVHLDDVMDVLDTRTPATDVVPLNVPTEGGRLSRPVSHPNGADVADRVPGEPWTD